MFTFLFFCWWRNRGGKPTKRIPVKEIVKCVAPETVNVFIGFSLVAPAVRIVAEIIVSEYTGTPWFNVDNANKWIKSNNLIVPLDGTLLAIDAKSRNTNNSMVRRGDPFNFHSVRELSLSLYFLFSRHFGCADVVVANAFFIKKLALFPCIISHIANRELNLNDEKRKQARRIFWVCASFVVEAANGDTQYNGYYCARTYRLVIIIFFSSVWIVVRYRIRAAVHFK